MSRWIYISLMAVATMTMSCVSTKEKKSAKYYLEHETKIKGILSNYEELYRTQAFNLGFAERDYSKVGLDIITDTIRYAITNQQRASAIRETITAFRYDTTKLRKLYTDMFEIRSIWLVKDDMYYDGSSSVVTYLSFRSVAAGNPFLDRKYYTLVFFDPKVMDAEFRAYILSLGFSNIKDNVYFKIMGRFR